MGTIEVTMKDRVRAGDVLELTRNPFSGEWFAYRAKPELATGMSRLGIALASFEPGDRVMSVTVDAEMNAMVIGGDDAGGDGA